MTGILIAAAVIIILFAVPLRAEAYIEYSGEGIGCGLVFRICGLRIRLPKNIRFKKKPKKDGAPGGTEPEETGESRAGMLIGFARENLTEVKELVYAVLEYMRKRLIKIRRLALKTVIGVGDAMETALIYGAEAAAVYNIVGIMDRHMRLKEHEIDLKPDFKKERLYIQFSADIRTNVFHTVVLAFIALRRALPLIAKLRAAVNGAEEDSSK